ncbi:hypothetical protein Sfulv_34330 [Streptomyces fulvorobeus]|uniref:Uncharacterized protein n=1 Tax=Streptomyces fulvorobeus TaxID=284028 RepID=A0A7J0C802_9ACTN|nr:hypothetical protein Sfulv_34330 [Streptomyces fulvorobeus]
MVVGPRAAVVGLRGRDDEGGQSQGAGNSGNGGTNTHVFPSGERGPAVCGSPCGARVVYESGDSIDQTGLRSEWLYES